MFLVLFLSMVLRLYISRLIFDWFSIFIPFKFNRCFFLVKMTTKRSRIVWDFSTSLLIDGNKLSSGIWNHRIYRSYFSFSFFFIFTVECESSTCESSIICPTLLVHCNDNFLLFNLLWIFFIKRNFGFFSLWGSVFSLKIRKLSELFPSVSLTETLIGLFKLPNGNKSCTFK